MLTLNEVFKKAGDENVALVIDGPIHYMVLNTKLNIMSLQVVEKIISIIDKVEATEGEAVFVTINSGSKVFSAGFNAKIMMSNFQNIAAY